MQQSKFSVHFSKNCENFRKRPNASERAQTHPNASKRIHTGPNGSKQVWARPKLRKTCENIENLRKIVEKFRETCEIISVTGCIAQPWSKGLLVEPNFSGHGRVILARPGFWLLLLFVLVRPFTFHFFVFVFPYFFLKHATPAGGVPWAQILTSKWGKKNMRWVCSAEACYEVKIPTFN